MNHLFEWATFFNSAKCNHCLKNKSEWLFFHHDCLQTGKIPLNGFFWSVLKLNGISSDWNLISGKMQDPELKIKVNFSIWTFFFCLGWTFLPSTGWWQGHIKIELTRHSYVMVYTFDWVCISFLKGCLLTVESTWCCSWRLHVAVLLSDFHINTYINDILRIYGCTWLCKPVRVNLCWH